MLCGRRAADEVRASPNSTLPFRRGAGPQYAFMKAYLVFAACLILAGCSWQKQNQREVLTQLEVIKSELARKRAETPRWAFANKHEINSAIFQWSHLRMEDIRKAEALAPEIEEKVRHYEALQGELTRKRMDLTRSRFPAGPRTPEAPASDEDLQTLSNRVAEARAPIADIIDRRNREAAQIRGQYSVEKLVSEYARDRFDLVVDSSGFSRSAVLYRTDSEVLDITDGVIELFRQKTKQ
jgi:hypothetical protein